MATSGANNDLMIMQATAAGLMNKGKAPASTRAVRLPQTPRAFPSSLPTHVESTSPAVVTITALPMNKGLATLTSTTPQHIIPAAAPALAEIDANVNAANGPALPKLFNPAAVEEARSFNVGMTHGDKYSTRSKSSCTSSKSASREPRAQQTAAAMPLAGGWGSSFATAGNLTKATGTTPSTSTTQPPSPAIQCFGGFGSLLHNRPAVVTSASAPKSNHITPPHLAHTATVTAPPTPASASLSAVAALDPAKQSALTGTSGITGTSGGNTVRGSTIVKDTQAPVLPSSKDKAAGLLDRQVAGMNTIFTERKPPHLRAKEALASKGSPLKSTFSAPQAETVIPAAQKAETTFSAAQQAKWTFPADQQVDVAAANTLPTSTLAKTEKKPVFASRFTPVGTGGSKPDAARAMPLITTQTRLFSFSPAAKAVTPTAIMSPAERSIARVSDGPSANLFARTPSMTNTELRQPVLSPGSSLTSTPSTVSVTSTTNGNDQLASAVQAASAVRAQGSMTDPIVIDADDNTNANASMDKDLKATITVLKIDLTEVKDQVMNLEKACVGITSLVGEMWQQQKQYEDFRDYLGTPASRKPFKVDVTYPSKAVHSIPVMGITFVGDLIRDARMAALMGPNEGKDPYIKVGDVDVGHRRMLFEVGINGPTTKTIVFGYN